MAWRRPPAPEVTARSSRPVPVRPRLRPSGTRGLPTGRPRLEVALQEVDAAVAARDPGLIGRLFERRPRERDVLQRNRAGFEFRAAPREGSRRAEAVAAREQTQDLRTGGAEVAVTGRILGERRRREGRRLIREPAGAVDLLRALVRAAPGADLPVMEEVPDGGDRP